MCLRSILPSLNMGKIGALIRSAEEIRASSMHIVQEFFFLHLYCVFSLYCYSYKVVGFSNNKVIMH